MWELGTELWSSVRAGPPGAGVGGGGVSEDNLPEFSPEVNSVFPGSSTFAIKPRHGSFLPIATPPSACPGGGRCSPASVNNRSLRGHKCQNKSLEDSGGPLPNTGERTISTYNFYIFIVCITVNRCWGGDSEQPNFREKDGGPGVLQAVSAHRWSSVLGWPSWQHSCF